ncbi:MAG: PilZ domain-containing protein [Planctomycetota bacterium]
MPSMNRRKTSRRGMKSLPIEVARVGFLSLFEKGPRQSAYAADISETGVRILTREPITRWESVFVILSNGGDASVRAKGRVAWCVVASREKRVYSIGIQFHNPSETVKAAIKTMLENQELDARLKKMATRHGGASLN